MIKILLKSISIFFNVLSKLFLTDTEVEKLILSIGFVGFELLSIGGMFGVVDGTKTLQLVNVTIVGIIKHPLVKNEINILFFF